MYNHIFSTNVLRLLEEHNMTKKELAEKSGASISFLSDLTTGKANPSLRVMQSISEAFDIPLPCLLETGADAPHRLPHGFERVTAILHPHQAYLVKKWNQSSKAEIMGEGGRQKGQKA